MATQEWTGKSLSELAKALQTEEVDCVTLTNAFLARIQKLDPSLHAFKLVTAERACAQAQAAQVRHAAKMPLGPLDGLPFVAKDLYDVKNLATGAGTRLLDNNIAAQTCIVVKRLEQAGMVLLGKTHTVQFAFGGVGMNTCQGTPKNPWHAVHHAPGGSSSGTGVAIAAGMAPMGLGSDTGGSVRIPASLNGISGLKTTLGRIPRTGVYSLSDSYDTVGPLGLSVEDCALTYQAIQGPDDADDSTFGIGAQDVLGDLKKGVKGLRLAVLETLFETCDAEVESGVRQAVEMLKNLGAQVESIHVPELTEMLNDRRRHFVVGAEALVHNAHWIENHFDDLDPLVSSRIAAARTFSAADYYAVKRHLATLQKTLLTRMGDADAMLAPTTPITACPIDDMIKDPKNYSKTNLGYLRNTVVGNLLGLCATATPCGFNQAGLPISLMVYGRPFAEAMTLRIAWAFEQAWPQRRQTPDLSWAGA